MLKFIRNLFPTKESEPQELSFPLSSGTRNVLAPKNIWDLPKICLWCDKRSFAAVSKIYLDVLHRHALLDPKIKEKGTNEITDRVTHLNHFTIEGRPFRYWHEVAPHAIANTYWVICWRDLTPDEAASIPAIGTSFQMDRELGMMIAPSQDVVFLRGGLKVINCEIIPPDAPIPLPFDLSFTENKLKQNGWKSERLKKSILING